MNVFYLDHDTKICAEYHNDKHCVRMVLEYAQLLSTAHRIIDRDLANRFVYKATHKNHPSAIWVRQNQSNYDWLYSLFVDLAEEYTYRYERKHLSYKKLKHILAYPPNNIEKGTFTQPTPAMPDHCKIPGDSLSSYRRYYKRNKKHISKWTKRPIPSWFTDDIV